MAVKQYISEHHFCKKVCLDDIEWKKLYPFIVLNVNASATGMSQNEELVLHNITVTWFLQYCPKHFIWRRYKIWNFWMEIKNYNKQEVFAKLGCPR